MRHLVLPLLCLAVLVSPARSADEVEKKNTNNNKGLVINLDTDLGEFGTYAKPAAAVKERFTTAWALFSARKEASYADLAADAAFQKLCAAQRLTHLGGPMLGCITPEGAQVWVRTTKPAQVSVQVAGVAKAFGPVASTAASDLSAVVTVNGLKPGGTYAYQVLIDGTPIAMAKHAAIVTPAVSGPTRIAFGTCSHRQGLGNTKLIEAIRARRPAAMLLYGDVAVQGRWNHLGMHRSDFLMRDSFAAWSDLVCTVPVYISWDDHDYFGNDLSGIPPGYTDADRRGIRDVFRTSWVNPAYGDGTEGIYFRSRIGACDLIMLDTRYFRQGRGKSFLGDKQMAWLEQQLGECKGPFIIISSGTMWSDYVSKGKDSWGGFDPQGREKIFTLIEKKRIPGVLLISGDRHGARAFRIPRPSGHTFYEFEPASLGDRGGPEATNPEWKDVQLYGQAANKHAFGEFDIDPAGADPTVTFRLIDEAGKELYTLPLKRSQLTPR